MTANSSKFNLFICFILCLLFLSGCGPFATRQLWEDKNKWELTRDDMISTKTTLVHTVGIYLSEDSGKLCIPYRLDNDSDKSGRLVVKVKKSAVEALQNLMQDPTEYSVEGISGEYRTHTRRTGGDYTSAEKSQIFTLGLNIPLATAKSQLNVISDENAKVITFNNNTRIEPNIYMGQIDYFSYWSFNTTQILSKEAVEIKQALIDQNITTYIKDNKGLLRITPFAWVDYDGKIIKTPQVAPEAQHGAYDLLIAVEEPDKQVRYFRYRSGFYLALRNNGAFNLYDPYDDRIRIVKYDRNNNVAGIGLRVVRPFGSEDKILSQNISDCRTEEGWRLFSANRSVSYSLSFVDTKDNHANRYPVGVKILLTPVTVAYDIVTLPFIFIALLIFGPG